ncbi:MAG: DUF4468 domain-containing protein [Bacteroidales bacterium]|nr:DUF4468 domain-containing protein [Bacteroidales bacterium]
MKKFIISIFFLFILSPFWTLFGQDDYIITIEDKKISGISISSYPKALEEYVVNFYNDNLMTKSEDLKISYNIVKTNRAREIEYSNVKKFVASGVEHIPWHARSIPFKEDRIVFDTIVPVSDKSKEELYSLARSSIILGMSLTAEQIQKTLIEDKESGSIMVRKLTVGSGSQGKFTSYIYFDLLIRVKDGKARMTIGDINLHYAKGQIFNDAVVYNYDIKAEDFTTSWRKGNTIKSHYYKGLLLMFYNIEDVLIKNFVELYTEENPLSDW